MEADIEATSHLVEILSKRKTLLVDGTLEVDKFSLRHRLVWTRIQFEDLESTGDPLSISDLLDHAERNWTLDSSTARLRFKQ